jgi:hypothetical protein
MKISSITENIQCTTVKDLDDEVWEMQDDDSGFAGLGFYQLSECGLTSLDGCPEMIDASFDVQSNSLQSLVGGPKEIKGYYNVSSNRITSLDGIPEKIGGSLDLSDNKLTSLQGINKLKELGTSIVITSNPITSHILGVFFINGCTGLYSFSKDDLNRAVVIVNRHVSKGRAGLLPCQKELIEAGLADFAQI